jgi:hypothetical protein
MIQRRALLRLLSAAVADRLAAAAETGPHKPRKRVVLVTIGGVRRQESFSERGVVNIPRLFNDLLPKSLFYPYSVNEGVTSHFNTIASILTGVWQHVDDWGSEKPANPTLFHYLQKHLHTGAEQTWVVTSNKQLTANIGPGANVILSKQLMIEAVERIIMGQTSRHRLEREQILQEMTAVLETDYERIGWGVPSVSTFQDPTVKNAFIAALTDFIRGPGAPASGDELTFLVAREVLQRVAPAMLMVNFSDMEVAHSGSYSLHLGGVRRADALCGRLWDFIQGSPELQPSTTLIIMNEFGRDPDGSSTNGFFNHRTNTECCRVAWTMVLGAGVQKPLVVERPMRQIDMAPSIASWMGFESEKAAGSVLPEFHA